MFPPNGSPSLPAQQKRSRPPLHDAPLQIHRLRRQKELYAFWEKRPGSEIHICSCLVLRPGARSLSGGGCHGRRRGPSLVLSLWIYIYMQAHGGRVRMRVRVQERPADAGHIINNDDDACLLMT